MGPFWFGWVVLGYASGSVPFGVLMGRARGIDVRLVGSGNVGATNVSRALGRRWGVLCFLLDVAKGLAPVLAAGWCSGFVRTGPPTGAAAWQWLGVALAAVLGHMFPPWLGFRGGKGVATGLGAILGMWPVMTLPALAAGVTWAVLVALLRFVSLASMVAALMLPLYIVACAMLRGRPVRDLLPFVLVSAAIALLIVVRHRTNIGRLLSGSESRIGPGSR